jgi:hypothetical protein
MVHVSSQTFGSSVEKGKIYYFKSSKLVSTTQAHFFIVIANPSDDLIIFTCCTSQFEKRARFIELKSDSYVDCNRYFQYSKAELIQMYELNRIEFIGYVQDSKLEEIRQGIIDSPLIVNEIKGLI